MEVTNLKAIPNVSMNKTYIRQKNDENVNIEEEKDNIQPSVTMAPISVATDDTWLEWE